MGHIHGLIDRYPSQRHPSFRSDLQGMSKVPGFSLD